MRPACLLAVLLSLPVPITAAALEPEALLKALREAPPVRQPFQELRFRRALKAPLHLSGTLAWQGEWQFERHVEQPYHESGVVSGRTLVVRRERGAERVIPLARAPELQVLFGGLSALFSGDLPALRGMFDIGLEGGETWRLRLQPKEAALREKVAWLELRGRNGQAHCLLLRQPGADTLTVFDVRPLPADGMDFEAAVAAYCPLP